MAEDQRIGLGAWATFNDEALVAASNWGDQAAFDEIVARYARKLFRIACHIMHNAADAQDVVQETLIKVFRNLDRFRADSKFSTWLYRIVVNQSLMELRKQRTKASAAGVSLDPGADGELPIDFSDWRPNPEEQYKQSELADLLNQALEQLRPALRVAFVMHDIEGLSLQETAEALSLSMAAVKTRSLRARLDLRERLAAHFKRDELGKQRTSNSRPLMARAVSAFA